MVCPYAVSGVTVWQLAKMLAQTVGRRCRGPGRTAVPSLLSGRATIKSLPRFFLRVLTFRVVWRGEVVDCIREDGALFNLIVTPVFCRSFSTRRKWVRCSWTVPKRWWCCASMRVLTALLLTLLWRSSPSKSGGSFFKQNDISTNWYTPRRPLKIVFSLSWAFILTSHYPELACRS